MRSRGTRTFDTSMLHQHTVAQPCTFGDASLQVGHVCDISRQWSDPQRRHGLKALPLVRHASNGLDRCALQSMLVSCQVICVAMLTPNPFRTTLSSAQVPSSLTASHAAYCAGHSGPVSQVCCDTHSGVAISASYDKTLRIWSCSGQERACLRGHVAPVLELRTDCCGRAASGDRSGHARLWDLASGTCTWALKGVHEGHVTALAWADASGGNEAWRGCFATGGQDGRLRLWDPRAHSNPVKLALHCSDSGKGAVTGIILGVLRRSPANVNPERHLYSLTHLVASSHRRAGGPAASYMAATCGADGTVRIVDARAGVGELACIELTDFPYSFTAAGGLVLAGCGDGSVHAIDMATLQTLYALGANEHAVRTLDASRGKLVCSGDDGKALVYDFV